MLSENELRASLKKGVDAGAIPKPVVPVLEKAVSNNLTNKGDVNAKTGICNLDCLQASFQETFDKTKVPEGQRAGILSNVADSIREHSAAE